jgi:hypothetical protein
MAKLKMVEKGGKKVPAFAADGVGKMAKGGKADKPKKMAVGGLVGALMNKGKPGGMLAGAIPGIPGMLFRADEKKQREALMLAKKKSEAEAAARGQAQKMAKGGMCRGMGAATKGGKYKG